MARIGCTNDHRANFEAVLGHPVDDVRIYVQGENPPNGPWATVRNLAAAGYHVTVSFKPNATMANVGTGAEDARVDNISAFLETLDVPGTVGFNHEVENDGIASSVWQAAANRVYGRLAAGTAWPTIYIYLGGFRDMKNAQNQPVNNQFTVPPPSQWWPSINQPVFLGCDYYNWRSANPTNAPFANPSTPDRDVADLGQTLTLSSLNYGPGVNSYLQFASTLSPVPLLYLNEFGCAVENNAGGEAKRTIWLQKFSDQWRDDPRVVSAQYYDLDSSDGRVNWSFSGGGGILPASAASMAAFASIADGVTPPPPPPPPGSFVGAVTIGTRARLTA